ncbi:hypothetical protein BH11MYX1_BH11MYX1_40020 [soil metagenome]
MRTALLLALGLGLLPNCTNNPSKLDQAPEGSPPAGGLGSGSAALDEVFSEMREYTMAMVPIFVAWDGNCDTQVDRLLTLEPLVKKIRANIESVDEVALRDRMMPHKDEIQKGIEAALAKTGKTMKDLQDNEMQIKTKCGAEPKFHAAMERIGVFKKKAAPPSHQNFVPPANPTPAPPVPAPAAP